MTQWNLSKSSPCKKLLATNATLDDCRRRLIKDGYTITKEETLADGRIEILAHKGVSSVNTMPGRQFE